MNNVKLTTKDKDKNKLNAAEITLLNILDRLIKEE